MKSVEDQERLEEFNYSKPWYHGTPQKNIFILRKGSTITQHIDLARVFSHKPTIVSIQDNELRHDGNKPGFLYTVCEVLSPEEIYPHPRSSMEWGMEWLTKLPLSLSLLGPTEIIKSELLTDTEITNLKMSTANSDV